MIYLDTNAFYLFIFEDANFSSGVKKIFEDIEKGKEIGLTSCLTLDELAYISLMKLIEKKYNSNPSEKIREKPEVILEFMPRIKEIFGIVFSFDNLEIADVDEDLVAVIPEHMERLLLPRDSIHYQTMRAYDCKRILSTDTGFDRLNDVVRIKPEEIK